MLKFRSMSVGSAQMSSREAKDAGALIKVTKAGRFLRATAMDELPQLVNILRGDMSFVGPRPLLPSEVEELDPDKFSTRSSVRPGLTGLAQVCADKYISNQKKIEYDLRYVNSRSFWLDIKLILRSISITVKRKWEAESR